MVDRDEPGRLRQGVRRAHRPGDAHPQPIELCVPGSIRRRVSRQLRGAHEAVATVRSWSATECWLSPTCGIGRHEREAVGRDGERYAWTRLVVFEVRDGRNTSMCVFELEDEEAAFAYAEERARAHRKPPAGRQPRQPACGTLSGHAMRSHMPMPRPRSSPTSFVLRRSAAAERRSDRAERVRTAVERIFEQYTGLRMAHAGGTGRHLQSGRSRWSNEAGYETSYLHVTEIDDDGRITY